MARRSWGTIRRTPAKATRYQASYVGPDLARHTAPFTFTSKLDAERWLSDERRLIERLEWTPPGDRLDDWRGNKFGDYAEGWLKTRPLKPRTKKGYEELLSGPLSEFKPLTMRAITPERVRGWYAKMGASKPTRRAHAYGLLHAIFNTAVKDGVVKENPCTISGAMNAKTQKVVTPLTVKEVTLLAENAGKYRTLILIGAWTGLRWGEAVELRKKDFTDDSVIVTRAVTHRSGKCHISTPKDGEGRIVVLPPHIRTDIQEHLKPLKDEDLLFKPVRACHLPERPFRDAVKEAAGKPVSFHDLRHFHGTQTARVGNLPETMRRLGHSTAKASLIYQQVASGRDYEVAEALSRLT